MSDANGGLSLCDTGVLMGVLGGDRRAMLASVDAGGELSADCRVLIFEHVDPGTARTFQVTVASRDTDAGKTLRFFVTEFCPSGQLVAPNGDAIEAPGLLDIEAEHGPNRFIEAAEEAGFCRDRIVMVAIGAQMEGGFESIEDALDVITYCIVSNRRYSLFSPLEHREAERLANGQGVPDLGVDWVSKIRLWAESVA